MSQECQIRKNVPRRCNYLLTGPGETILDILGAEEAHERLVRRHDHPARDRRTDLAPVRRVARPDLDRVRLVRAGRASARL